jgi:hypothetical protein
MPFLEGLLGPGKATKIGEFGQDRAIQKVVSTAGKNVCGNWREICRKIAC